MEEVDVAETRVFDCVRLAQEPCVVAVLVVPTRSAVGFEAGVFIMDREFCFTALQAEVGVFFCGMVLPRSGDLATDCHLSGCGTPLDGGDRRTDPDNVLGTAADEIEACVDGNSVAGTFVDCKGVDASVLVAADTTTDGGVVPGSLGLTTGPANGGCDDGVASMGAAAPSRVGADELGTPKVDCARVGAEAETAGLPFSDWAGDNVPRLLFTLLTVALFFRFRGGLFFLSVS